MRFVFPIAAVLLITACTPRAVEPAPAPAPTPARPSDVLVGLTASELNTRFGQPSFQVSEGVGTKLQWSRNGCVLDAYLYPPQSGQGAPHVTHVDSRRPSGDDIDLQTCLALLAR